MYPKNHVCMYLLGVANVVKPPYLPSIAKVNICITFSQVKKSGENIALIC